MGNRIKQGDTVEVLTGDDPDMSECETPPHLPELLAPPLTDCNRYDDLLSELAYAAG